MTARSTWSSRSTGVRRPVARLARTRAPWVRTLIAIAVIAGAVAVVLLFGAKSLRLEGHHADHQLVELGIVRRLHPDAVHDLNQFVGEGAAVDPFGDPPVDIHADQGCHPSHPVAGVADRCPDAHGGDP